MRSQLCSPNVYGLQDGLKAREVLIDGMGTDVGEDDEVQNAVQAKCRPNMYGSVQRQPRSLSPVAGGCARGRSSCLGLQMSDAAAQAHLCMPQKIIHVPLYKYKATSADIC